MTNPKPIEKARDADLRLSANAMQRAAQRARELAARTGTSIVVSDHGVIREIEPEREQPGRGPDEPAASNRATPSPATGKR